MRVFAFLIEPANYTMSIVDRVYRPLGIDYCFLKGRSKASDVMVSALSELSLLRKITYIIRMLRRYEAFITNSYSEKTGLLILFLNILICRKPIAIESDTELHIPARLVKRLAKRLFLGWLFSRKCVYGFPGGYHGHVQLFKHYGMPESHITVMPMVVDNEIYRRVSVPCRGKVFRFVFMGRLIPLKQVDKIILAFSKVANVIENVELHIIGDGVEVNRLKAMSKGVSVIFHGAVFGDQKVRLLHEMDCLILYSSFEQWGLVVNEALASGIPCIVSDKVGCRNDLILGECQSGIVVPFDDTEKLVTAMQTMVTDCSAWQRYSENANIRMKQWDCAKYMAQLDCFIKCVEGRFAC